MNTIEDQAERSAQEAEETQRQRTLELARALLLPLSGAAMGQGTMGLAGMGINKLLGR